MAATVFTNEVILLAINKIKESAPADAAAAGTPGAKGGDAAGGGGTPGAPAADGDAATADPAAATDVNVTKKDVMDALFILTYLKHKHKKAEDAKAAPPSTAQITATGSHNAVYSHTEINAANLQNTIDKVLRQIDNKKIDGSNAVDSPTALANHLKAKQNLARIVYFLALEACDALTRTNKFTSISADKTRYRIYQGGNTTSTYSSAIETHYTSPSGGGYSTRIAFYKMLFLIASTLADNEINLDIKGTKTEGRRPVMYFFNDTSQGIVEINSNLIEDTNIRGTFTRIVKNTEPPHITETDHTSIKFKTPAPQIHGVPDVTVNLRVIQTILIGNNVHEYKAGALDITSRWSASSTDTIAVKAATIANELLTKYTIDVGIASA